MKFSLVHPLSSSFLLQSGHFLSFLNLCSRLGHWKIENYQVLCITCPHLVAYTDCLSSKRVRQHTGHPKCTFSIREVVLFLFPCSNSILSSGFGLGASGSPPSGIGSPSKVLILDLSALFISVPIGYRDWRFTLETDVVKFIFFEQVQACLAVVNQCRVLSKRARIFRGDKNTILCGNSGRIGRRPSQFLLFCHRKCYRS